MPARPPLEAAIQRKALVDPQGYFAPGGDYVPAANSVTATNIKLANPANLPPDGYNEPDKALWTGAPQDYMPRNKLTGGFTRYKLMHLLNGRMGGPGAAENLVPGTGHLNTSVHFNRLEKPAQEHLQQGATITSYKTTVTTRPANSEPNPDKNMTTPQGKAAWESTIHRISGDYNYTLPSGTEGSKSLPTTEDALEGKKQRQWTTADSYELKRKSPTAMDEDEDEVDEDDEKSNSMDEGSDDVGDDGE